MDLYVWQTQWILIISAGVILGGYVLRYLGQALGIGKTGRCRKCGKKIDKSEMYCFDHRRDSIWEAQEKNRLEGTGKFTRSQKRN